MLVSWGPVRSPPTIKPRRTPRWLGLVLALGWACGAEPAPWVVVPAKGSRGGGQPVSIHGSPSDDEGEPVTLTGHGPVAVYFGSRAAFGVVIEGETLLRVTTPESDGAGPVPVQLRFDDGLFITIPDGYRYTETEGIVLTPLGSR